MEFRVYCYLMGESPESLVSAKFTIPLKGNPEDKQLKSKNVYTYIFGVIIVSKYL